MEVEIQDWSFFKRFLSERIIGIIITIIIYCIWLPSLSPIRWMREEKDGVPRCSMPLRSIFSCWYQSFLFLRHLISYLLLVTFFVFFLHRSYLLVNVLSPYFWEREKGEDSLSLHTSSHSSFIMSWFLVSIKIFNFIQLFIIKIMSSFSSGNGMTVLDIVVHSAN